MNEMYEYDYDPEYDHIDLCSCFDPIFDPPPEQIKEWEYMKYLEEREPTMMDMAEYVRYPDDTLYYFVGNSCIKVSEHFNHNGKTMNELVSDVIQYKLRAV